MTILGAGGGYCSNYLVWVEVFRKQAARVGVVERRDVLVVLGDRPHPLTLLLLYNHTEKHPSNKGCEMGNGKKRRIQTSRKLTQKQKKKCGNSIS